MHFSYEIQLSKTKSESNELRVIKLWFMNRKASFYQMKKDEVTKGESFNKGGESIILSPKQRFKTIIKRNKSLKSFFITKKYLHLYQRNYTFSTV
jgi:hypothetical protein